MTEDLNGYDLPGAEKESEIEDASVNSQDTKPVVNLEPIESAAAEVEPQEEVKPPSKFRTLVHQISVWLLAILGFGLVLYLVFFFAMYRPMDQSYQSLQQTSTEMEGQLSDYRNQLEELNADYEGMVTERNDLLDENELYQAYVNFLKFKNDMLLLQKAYLEEDLDAATLAKSKATNDLEDFVPTLEVLNEPMVDVLRTRLALLTTLEKDMTANVDEVNTIYTFLLEMEDDLFGTLE